MSASLPPPGEDDEALAAGIAAGSEAALQAVHRRYAPLVFHLACKSLDRGAAEEITQDVFLSVWRKADSFEAGRGSFRTWLLAIAHHRILDELRSRSRRPGHRDAVPAEAVELAAQDPQPDELLWRDYQRASVEAALAALPEPQRRALRLAYFAELSHEAVAGVLQVPLGTAKTRIRSGLRRLGRHLGALVAVLALLLVAPGAYLVRRRLQEDNRRARALDLLANSQCRILRLVPADAGTAPESGMHASLRCLPGRATAVLTLSHFPAPPAGLRFVLWLDLQGQWTPVALAPPNAAGAALQILEVPALEGTWPKELRITLEEGRVSAPAGAGIVAWRSPAPS